MKAHATLLFGVLWTAALAGCVSEAPQRSSLEVLDLPRDYVRADTVPDLLIEIDYVAGREPSQMALDGLLQRAREMTSKINITLLPPTEIPSQSAIYGPYDHDEPYAIHEATFDHCGPVRAKWEQAAVLHVLYLDGESDPSAVTSFAGLYLRQAACAGVIVALPDTWSGEFGFFSLPGSDLEGIAEDMRDRQILVHEFGHAIGLVGHGAPVTKERRTNDPCGCHSENPESVMYAGIDNATPDETLRQLQRYVRNGLEPIWAFDADDQADVRALREGKP